MSKLKTINTKLSGYELEKNKSRAACRRYVQP